MRRLWFLFILGLLAGVAAEAAVVCSVATSGTAFGAYNPVPGQASESTGTISVTCSGTAGESANYSIKISIGTASSYSLRQMTAGNCTMYYNLYTDVSRSQVWGDGTGGTTYVSDSIMLSSPSSTKHYIVYGKISGGQYQIKAGSYGDNLLITLTY